MKSSYVYKTCIVNIYLVLFATAFAQAPDTLWTRTYGWDSSEGAGSVQQTSDGGFFLTGTIHIFSPDTVYDLLLIKTDSLGDTVWTRIYGTNKDELSCYGQPTSDGGYIALTHYMRDIIDGLNLIKIDAYGNLLWQKLHEFYSVRGLACLDQTTDGGYVIASDTGLGIGNMDCLVIKTDSLGNIIWTKNYGGSKDDYPYAITKTSDDGYVMVGATYSFGPGSPDNSNVYLVKIDSTGNMQWWKAHGTYGDEFGQAIQQTTDEGYIISGLTTSGAGELDIYLVKTDSLGDTLWTGNYGGPENDHGMSVCQASDGGYATVGYTYSFGAGSCDVYVVKTDFNGNALWTKTIGADSVERASSIQETSDGGYIIAGGTRSFGAGNMDAYLIKLAPDTLGIEEHQVRSPETQESFIDVAPNPFKNKINISWKTIGNELQNNKISIRIYDATGKLVRNLLSPRIHSTQYRTISWNGVDNADQPLPSGVYFLRMQVEDMVSTKQIILLR